MSIHYDWKTIREKYTVYEDKSVFVINKPPGISVVGERNEKYDLLTLAHEAKEEVYLAHRIDKVTSGAVLFAKSITVHSDITRQFNKRTTDKAYLAITHFNNLPESGIINLPLSVGRKKKIRVAAKKQDIYIDKQENCWNINAANVFTHIRVYSSLSKFKKILETKENTLLLVKPITGRRHQIRVHLAWIGYPIIGDPLFDKKAGDSPRTFLHSWKLGFYNLGINKRIEVEAIPEEDFWIPLRKLLTNFDTQEVLDSACNL